MLKKRLALILAMFLFSMIYVNAVEPVNETNDSVPDQNISQYQTEEIGEGLFYNIRSSVFKWFQKVITPVRSIFVKNVETYESEAEKNREYSIKRNENLKKSLEGNGEPPFKYTRCSYITATGEIESDFCSCGDGICASYEDKCKCPKDCGSCPEGTVCKRGECVEYVKDTCMNTVCEEGENETCPWDCKVYMQEEKEEVLDNEKERARREEFFRKSSMSEEEIKKTVDSIETRQYRNEEETLPEPVDE